MQMYDDVLTSSYSFDFMHLICVNNQICAAQNHNCLDPSASKTRRAPH